MGEQARGVEKVLTAGPSHAQISVRVLLPILCALLAVELTALGFLGQTAERAYANLELNRLPWEARVALNSAKLHWSVPGIATACLGLLVLTLLSRRGVFDSTGRWFCLAAAVGMAMYAVAFVAAIVMPLTSLSYGFSR